MPSPLRPLFLVVLTGLGAALAGGACAADAGAAQKLHARALAATCAQCHGTDGQAVAQGGQPRLAGMEQEFLLAQLMAFRGGQRPATVMHQITKGYSEAQLTTLAQYFAAQK